MLHDQHSRSRHADFRSVFFVSIFRVATGDVFDKISFLRTSATTLRKWSSAPALLVFVALPLRVGSNQNHVDVTSSASIGSHNRTVATHRTRYNRVGFDALPAQATRVQRRLSPARGTAPLALPATEKDEHMEPSQNPPARSFH
jgi:hypothetical protein